MAKTVLGIYVEGDFIRAAIAQSSRGNIQWLNFFDFQLADDAGGLNPRELLARFKEGLDNSGASWDEVAVAFDMSKVAIKTIDFPFANLKKIEQTLPLQLEDSLPFSLGEFAYDLELMFKSNGQNRALVALVEKSKLKDAVENFTALGLEPAVIIPVPSALMGFVDNAKMDGSWILLFIGKSWAAAVLASGNKPLGVSAFEVNKSDPKGAASKILALVRSQIGAEELAKELRIVSATDGHWQQFVAEVSALLGAKPADAGEALGVSVPSGHLAAAGAAMNALHLGKKKSINFRKGEFVYHRAKTQERKMRFRLQIMGALILALALSQGIYKYVSLKSELGALEEKEQKLFSQALPNTPLLKPLDQLKSKVDIDRKKLAILGGIANGRLTTIEALKKISEAIPDAIKVDVTKLEIMPDAIRINGSTTDYESVDRVVAELGKVKEFISIQKDEAKKTSDTEIKFRLTITLTEKGGMAAP